MIIQKLCSLCILHTEIVPSPCGFIMEAPQRWNGDCVVLGIRGPKLYNVTFLFVLLVEMAPKQKVGQSVYHSWNMGGLILRKKALKSLCDSRISSCIGVS